MNREREQALTSDMELLLSNENLVPTLASNYDRCYKSFKAMRQLKGNQQHRYLHVLLKLLKDRPASLFKDPELFVSPFKSSIKNCKQNLQQLLD